MSSIFTAELTAIKLALFNIHKTNQKLHILFSDSKWALQSLSHKNLSNRITQDIFVKYNNLYNHHCNINFCWIPSQVGIKSNTEADKLARVNTNSSTQVIPISASDALPTLRNYIRTKWQATWDCFPNNKLYKIFPKIQLFPPLHYSYSRNEQVIFNRLLIGHTHLTHSCLFNKEQPSNCNYCKSLLTVEQMLTSCSAYKNITEKHYSNYQFLHIVTNIL